MTDFSQAFDPLHLKPGKHNMASAAFAELRAARREGREPQGTETSFGDLLDTINPLQHIPVVSEAYRHLTGDGIAPEARVAGGLLYGGPVGAIASVFSLAISGNEEEGIGDRVFAGIVGSSPAGDPAVQIAAAVPEETPESAVIPPSAQASPLARQAAAGTPALPRLSPDAFQALIGSFADPDALRAANLDISAEEGPGSDTERSRSEAIADAGLMSAMQQAMDKYDALRKSGQTADER